MTLNAADVLGLGANYVDSSVNDLTFREGQQVVVRFANDFGLSVLDDQGWVEVALVRFFSPNIHDFRLVYNRGDFPNVRMAAAVNELAKLTQLVAGYLPDRFVSEKLGG